MTSVVEGFCERDRRRLAAMSVTERIRLAFRLGDRDLEVFRSRHCLSREAALRELRHKRQLGRTPCSFFESDP